MKRIFCFLLFFYSFSVMAQNQITTIAIILPTKPIANYSLLATGSPVLSITAQTTTERELVPAIVTESRILITIKRGDVIVCGKYTYQTAPKSNFNTTTKTWSASDILKLLGQECNLQLELIIFASSFMV